MSLTTRMFLVMVFLILVVLGLAIAVTTWVGNQVANEAVSNTLESSRAVQSSIEENQLGQLGLIARLFANDPFIVAYLAEAAEDIDTTSILDQLDQRREEVGYDFAIVLDTNGQVVARTDRVDAVGEDLSERPLISLALDEGEAYGVWREDNELYNAVAMPLVRNFDLFGYLVAGFSFGDALARQVQEMSETEVAYLLTGERAGEVVASSLDAASATELTGALRSIGPLADVLAQSEQRTVQIRNEDWVALSSPLQDAFEEQVGVAITLASLDRQLSNYRRILRVLFGVGAVSLLLALPLSWLLSKMTTSPLKRLVGAVESARVGDFDQRLDTGRDDEVGRLSGAFDGLLGELREKRDMETYLASLSRNLPEPDLEKAPVDVSVEPRTLLLLETRSVANPKATREPEAALERLAHDFRRAIRTASGKGGRYEAMLGHRLLASFSGPDATFRAVEAAGRLQEALPGGESPVIGIGTGDVVSGPVVVTTRPERAVLGLAVRQLEGLLREGSAGDIVLSEDARNAMLPSAQEHGLDLREQRGVLSVRPVYVIDGRVARQLTHGEAPTAVLTGDELPGASGSSSGSQEVGPGSVLGERYAIVSILGAGGMGVVYKARDRELDDFVALKMLRPHVWGNDTELERLKNEIKLARKITHKNVLRTFDFGEIDGASFISMEYVRGLTLRYLLDQDGRLPYSAGVRLSKQLLDGLVAAHAEGVLHCDIKPENMILESNGNAKLMDFGIASKRRRGGEAIEATDEVMGTPLYMSPEVLQGSPPDERSDLYAVGLVLYEVFTGVHPFLAATSADVIANQLRAVPKPPSEHWNQLPRGLEALILSLVEKDPLLRPASAQAVRETLGEVT